MRATRTEAERSLIGAALMSPDLVEALLVEHKLSADHFTPANGSVFAAITWLHDNHKSIDELTLTDRLLGAHPNRSPDFTRQEIAVLAAGVPNLGAWRSYVDIVKQEAEWARRGDALAGMADAIHDRDEERFQALEFALQQEDRPDTGTLSPTDLGNRTLDWLMATDTNTIELPLPLLTEKIGGLRPGDVTIVAGWTSHGKTLWSDAVLRHAAKQGFKAHAYINEMSATDRALRTVTALTGIPLSKLRSKNVHGPEAQNAMGVLSQMPFGITECAGWPAADIARHIRRHKWDVCCVDLFNLIPGAEKTDTADNISATINAAARQAGTHVLLVCQLNQERNKGILRPAPVLRDIRSTGQLANDAENVMFVHRDEHETANSRKEPVGVAEIGETGTINVAKARNGELGYQLVQLDTRTLTFVER